MQSLSLPWLPTGGFTLEQNLSVQLRAWLVGTQQAIS